MLVRSLKLALTVGMLAVLLVPVAVSAGPDFDDVPPDNVFHDDIVWLADHG